MPFSIYRHVLLLYLIYDEYGYSYFVCHCRYVPSFIPPPLATKGKESEKKVSTAHVTNSEIKFVLSILMLHCVNTLDLMILCCIRKRRRSLRIRTKVRRGT